MAEGNCAYSELDKLRSFDPTECEHGDVVGLWMVARMASNRFQNPGD